MHDKAHKGQIYRQIQVLAQLLRYPWHQLKY